MLLIYYCILRGNRKAQNAFLFVASLGFYAWGEPLFILVMLLSITGNWIFGLILDQNRSSKCTTKRTVVIAVAFNLGILFVFKYLTFVLNNVNLFMKNPITVPIINLPIGISFFTFQAISYIGVAEQ